MAVPARNADTTTTHTRCGHVARRLHEDGGGLGRTGLVWAAPVLFPAPSHPRTPGRRQARWRTTG
ncbi:hypothetical protein EF879_23870 [Micromonospora sp. HM5-17]|nr:hypothetical protein EF879_23870 [Micromonospora sp. HM5-17]